MNFGGENFPFWILYYVIWHRRKGSNNAICDYTALYIWYQLWPQRNPKNHCWGIPSEKIGQNIHPLESRFLSLIINIGLVQVHFGQFWPPWTIGGVWGGSGGIWGGLQTPKMTLLLGGHFRPWNALFWVITTCLTMFLRFWVKIGPSGPKKGRFWPK